MKRCIALVRVSSREQQREGFSLSVQENGIRRAASVDQNEIAEVVSIAESASPGKARKIFRETIARLIREAKAGRLHGVYFARPDRASRNYRDLAVLEELVKVHGVLVRFVTPDIDTSTPQGALMLGVLVSIARFQTESNIQEIVGGHRARVNGGLFVGHAPFGYENFVENERRLIRIHPENRDKVPTIFGMFATGNYTVRSLLAALHAAGVTYSPTQPRFTNSKLDKILHDRAYIGEVYYRGEWRQGSHEPLMDRALFDQVQALLGGRTYKKHLMTYSHQLVTCGACGLFIVGEPKTKMTKSGEERTYRYYRCTAANSDGHEPIRLTEAEMDRQVLALFEHLRVKDREVREWIIAALRDLCTVNEEQDRAALSKLKVHLTRVSEREHRLARMMLDAKLSPEQYDGLQAELRAEKQAIVQGIEAAGRDRSESVDLVADTFELSQHLAEKWDAANVPERRQILQILALNWTLEGRTLLPSLRKPFDVLADGLLAAATVDGRGDRI